MKITVPRNPKLTFKVPRTISLRGIDFFYNHSFFAKRQFPVKPGKILLTLIILTTVTFVSYFLTSYIRNDDLSNAEIFKQVLFINYTLWLAYLFFVIGLNGLLIVLLRLKRIVLDIPAFMANQTFVAILAFFLMRMVATMLIIIDEKVPFEINVNYQFFRFNLLTVLFAAQIAVALFIYNYLKINLPEKFNKHSLVSFIVAVIYVASIWALTAP